MITLLAESKTMSAQQMPIDESYFRQHIPIMEKTADAIMANMASLSPSQISDILCISSQLAIKAHNLAYDFPYKLSGYKSIFGFTGEAFKGLDIRTINKEALDNIDNNLRIISSVYGILKPSDIIKPYRCEFNKPIAPEAQTPIKVFKSKNTIEFVKYIKENKISDIINLLPGDADKCLDWKIIRAFATVHKVCFQTYTSDGKLKTPIAKKLKESRGLMAREILEHPIESFKDLIALQSTHFVYSPADSKPGLPVFIVSD